MDSKNMKVLGKGTYTLASRSTEARDLIPVISLSKHVLSEITGVHPGCLAERRGRRKEPGECAEESPLHLQFMKTRKCTWKEKLSLIN